METIVLNSIESLNNNTIIICNKDNIPELLGEQSTSAKRLIENGENLIVLPGSEHSIWLKVMDDDSSLEDFRIAGASVYAKVKQEKPNDLTFYAEQLSKDDALAVYEGFLLSSYTFTQYIKEDSENREYNLPESFSIVHAEVNDIDMSNLDNTSESVFWARDMVNEPVSVINATSFAKAVFDKATKYGVEVEVHDKKQIESLRMGGLLAVNRGSIDPPTFTIATWRPDNAINEKPYVIVGKGVMYDTGGLSLKPTAGSMDLMKSDMAGAAAIAGTICNIAKHKLPIYVIALLPATDNRPSGNAYTPGDVVKMYNGLHVEVLNTDAEGRMILADAISYADKYDPELVIDMATLTGAAAVAIGTQASVVMGTADDKYFGILEQSGDSVHERVVRFPFYKEYDNMIRSKIADLKNLGGRDAGAITAGKFLSNFTEYPFIHIDIAGPAYITDADSYRTYGGTGYGVRLLTQFFENISKLANKN